jgi:hypothetical protein
VGGTVKARAGFVFPDGTTQLPAQIKGDTGPQGSKGDKGDKGDTGPQGPKGDAASLWCSAVNGGPCSCGSSREISRVYSRADAVTTVEVKLPNGSACTAGTVQIGVAPASYQAGQACLCETK